MSVKEVNAIPAEGRYWETDPRYKELANDIREIIERRIRKSQIVSKYPPTTMRSHMGDAIRRVCYHEYDVRNFHEIFTISCHKSDGILRWYVNFDIDKWDKATAARKGEKRE